MIRNTIVANVKANSNDQELRAILTEYERRLKEVESDSQQSSLKLRQIIDNLMHEKDELNQRLIRANHSKLAAIAEGGGEAPGSVPSDFDEAQQTTFYLWNCGVINSSLPIDKFIIQTSVASPAQLDKRLYT